MNFRNYLNENRDFKMSMNKIKRAMGKNDTMKDLEEFIEVEAKQYKYDLEEFSKYVKDNIKV